MEKIDSALAWLSFNSKSLLMSAKLILVDREAFDEAEELSKSSFNFSMSSLSVFINSSPIIWPMSRAREVSSKKVVCGVEAEVVAE